MTKFYNYDIVFQEIPNEVTLAINITNCPNNCKGCHSQHLQQDVGAELTETVIDHLLTKYKSAITCLCFMGGDSDLGRIEQLAKHVKTVSNVKTAWYSGRSIVPNLMYFDYIKLGRYIEKFGGLDSRTTNQKFYHVINNNLIDMTYLFWR